MTKYGYTLGKIKVTIFGNKMVRFVITIMTD